MVPGTWLVLYHTLPRPHDDSQMGGVPILQVRKLRPPGLSPLGNIVEGTGWEGGPLVPSANQLCGLKVATSPPEPQFLCL